MDTRKHTTRTAGGRTDVRALCAALALAAAAAGCLFRSGERVIAAESGAYTLTFRHYGIDMEEIERTIAIPLEDALSLVEGVTNTVSVAEDSCARVFIFFGSRRGARGATGRYEAIRDIAQRIYETLPSSAQKPEIMAADSGALPLWTAAIISKKASSEVRSHPPEPRLLNAVIKPALAGIEGVANIEVSGAGVDEITIALKPEAAAFGGITLDTVAAAIALNDVMMPAGAVMEQDRMVPVTFASRYRTAEELEKAVIKLPGGGMAALDTIAELRIRKRESDTIARLNGEKAAVITALPMPGADIGTVSKRINAALKWFEQYPVEFITLSDRGAEEQLAFRSALWAALQSMMAVALITALLGRRLRASIVTALFVPLTGLIAAALLTGAGGIFDKTMLAGLAAGIGAAVDAAILTAEKTAGLREPDQIRAAMRRLAPPLISGSLTTVIALAPLLFASALTTREMAAIAASIAAVSVTALILALTLLPCLVSNQGSLSQNSERSFLSRLCPHFFAAKPRNTPNIAAFCGGEPRANPPRFRALIVRGEAQGASPRSGDRAFHSNSPASRANSVPIPCVEKLKKTGRSGKKRGITALSRTALMTLVMAGCRAPVAVCLAAVLVTALGAGAVMIAGVRIQSEESVNSVYARVEFEGGLRAEETDRRMEDWARRVGQYRGVMNVQTSARAASAGALVSFDRAVITARAARELLRGEAPEGGFVYISEAGGGEAVWELKVFGGGAERCRAIARELAEICSTIPEVKQTVLNFKEGNTRLALRPNRERFVGREDGLSFAETANFTRGAVFGPVIYKRFNAEGDGEIDVRFKSAPWATLNRRDVPELALPVSGGVKLSHLMNESEEREYSSLRRENRRRIASISIVTAAEDPRKIRDLVMKKSSAIELDAGYSIMFDPEAITKAKALSGTVWYFLLALLFCYMLLALVNESFSLPLAALAVVPPSVAVPALCLAISGAPIGQAALCAFIAVSGLAISAGVLASQALRDELRDGMSGAELRRRVPVILRKRLAALMSTSATTAVSALPFLFLRENANTMIRMLSLVTVCGVSVSCVVALTLIPALALLAPRLFEGVGLPRSLLQGIKPTPV